MNKTVKGAAALGAAALILLGGTGTLAYWSAADAVDAGTVSSGHLKIASADVGSWTELTSADGSAVGPIADIGTYYLVPGDQVQYVQTFTVNAQGDNLVATVGTSGFTPDPALQPYIATTVAVTDSTGAAISQQLTSANDGDVVTVTVTITFDSAAGDAEDATINLEQLAIDLAQSTPTA